MTESSRTEKFLNILFKKPVFTVSNLLCIVRLCLLPVVFHFLMENQNQWALVIIVVGVLTDLVDGFIARRFGQISELGKFLDPFVDKLSILVVLGFLTYRSFISYEVYPLILTIGTGFLLFQGLVYLIATPFLVRKKSGISKSNMAGKVAAISSVITVLSYVIELYPWADALMIVTIGTQITAGFIYFLRDFHRRNKVKIGLANRITLIRIVLSPLLLLVFFSDGNSNYDNNTIIFKTMTLLLVIALVVSDKIDGNIARARGEISKLGKLMDPFADKIALITIFLCFVASGWASAWMVVLIYYREAMVSFLRTLAATEQIVLAAMISGKIKTATQSTVAITLFSLSFLRTVADLTGISVIAGDFFDLWDNIWVWLPWSLMLLVTIVSLISGIDYFLRNRKVIIETLKETKTQVA